MEVSFEMQTSRSQDFENGRSRGERRRAVLLINLGTPEAPETAAVRTYLTEFLSDPYVIKLPGGMKWLTTPLAAMIAFSRAKSSAALYRNIWTEEGSPLKIVTESQVSALQHLLPKGWQVFYAMRYGQPAIAEVLKAIAAVDFEELVIIPMYPQYSGASTGTALAEVYRWLQENETQVQLKVVNTWYDDRAYIDAQARLIHEFARARELTAENCFLLFSTHSLPQSYVDNGDPYQKHILRTVDLVTRRLGWPEERTAVSYQSRLGPAPWLSPSTETVLSELAEKGDRRVLVCPVSFTADCLETLEEVGFRFRDHFEALGGELHLCPALNEFDPFIKCLNLLARRGPTRVDEAFEAQSPLINGPGGGTLSPADIDSLMMIGISMASPLGDRSGPELVHLEAPEFRRFKKPQAEVVDLLQDIQRHGGLRECWLWNTCHRFELFGWLEPDCSDEAAEDVIAGAIEKAYGRQIDRGQINVLRGKAAHLHLLRTAAGLNSPLPGDVDIIEQLRSAHRMATYAGTIGELTNTLTDSALGLQENLEQVTRWGRFRYDYSVAALMEILPPLMPVPENTKCVVIGGSTTSISLLRVLTERFGVPSRNLTLVYRGRRHGRLIKLLRKAIGQGRRVRVESYAEDVATQAIADADLAFVAIDRREPVITAERLASARNLEPRPLTVIDFNTFASTEGLETLEGVRLIPSMELEGKVRSFSQCLLECEGFNEATEEVERIIREHVGLADGQTQPAGVIRRQDSDSAVTFAAVSSPAKDDPIPLATSTGPSIVSSESP